MTSVETIDNIEQFQRNFHNSLFHDSNKIHFDISKDSSDVKQKLSSAEEHFNRLFALVNQEQVQENKEKEI